MVNSVFDELEEARRKAAPAERKEAAASITRRVNSLMEEARATGPRLRDRLISRVKEESIMEQFSRASMAVWAKHPGAALLDLMPRSARLPVLNRQVVQAGFALAAHKAEKGRYPERLAALVPTYLKEIPEDHYVEKPLMYRRQGQGYIVYSVGPNMKDDGGRRDDDEEKDDIAISVE